MYGRALYDFKGKQDGDLTFREDDVIVVLEQDPSGWWIGEHCTNGTRGEFPYNYIELISEEEAVRTEKSKMAKSEGPVPTATFNGDKVVVLRVIGSEHSGRGHKLTVKIEAETESGKTKSTKKTVSQFRDLDVQMRKLFPHFEGILPPAWSDHAKFGTIDSERRETVLENYLMKFLGRDATDFLLLMWLFPGEKMALSSASPELEQAAAESQKAGHDRQSLRQTVRIQKTPTIAHVEFTWTPQDDAELYMQESQIISVLSQDTGSPGWWEGETVDGKRGLLPYNHVEVLEARVAAAVLSGTPLKKAFESTDDTKKGLRKSMSRISLGLFGKKGKPARERATIKPWALTSCEAFDRLIDNGFTMESDGKLCSMSPPKDSPKDGDFVQLTYVGYVYDGQQERLVEFDAADYPSKLSEGGPMEFFVGHGETIKGIEHAVRRMIKGQSVRLTVTPPLAYGAVGVPPDVPPNAHVVYDLTLDAFGNDSDAASQPQESVASPAVPESSKPAIPSSTKPGAPKLTKPVMPEPPAGFQTDAAAENASGFKAPQGTPMSLQEAIALRRNKIEQAPLMKPVAERQVHKPKPPAHVQIGEEPRERPVSRAAPQNQYSEPTMSFSVEELQEAVREKRLPEMGIDPSHLEDWLTNEEFEKAFKMGRGEFLLKPAWRQQALKRGLSLF